MKESIKILVYVLVVFALAGCSKEEVDETDKFIDVYSEMLVISAKKTLTDSTRRQQVDSLLTANKYTVDEFKEITDKYANDPVKWKDIYKEIVEEIDAKKRNTRNDTLKVRDISTKLR
jgi:hypothetical protein